MYPTRQYQRGAHGNGPMENPTKFGAMVGAVLLLLATDTAAGTVTLIWNVDVTHGT